MLRRDAARPAPGPLPAPRGTGKAPQEAFEGVTREPGEPLDAGVQARMEARLGHRFGGVRIHRDPRAADAVEGLGARAATRGRHVAFARGADPMAGEAGERLLAHELIHVAQQDAVGRTGRMRTPAPARAGEGHETEARQLATGPLAPGRRGVPITPVSGPAIQLQDAGTGTPAGAGSGAAGQAAPVNLTFVFRAPDDQYTKDVTDYTRNTLGDPNVIEVDNIDQVFAHLKQLKAAGGPKVAGIRLIGHGSTTGGIKMTPTGEAGRRFVTAEELEQKSQDKGLQATAAGVMAPGATVEFYGCNIGRNPKTGTALSTLFGSDVRTTSDTLRTGYQQFARGPEKGESGPVTITSSTEVDNRPNNKRLKANFDAWLLTRYGELVAAGDMAPRKTRAERLAAMREVFDRSGGTIRQLEIEAGGKVVTKGTQGWLRKWKTTKAPGGTTP